MLTKAHHMAKWQSRASVEIDEIEKMIKTEIRIMKIDDK